MTEITKLEAQKRKSDIDPRRPPDHELLIQTSKRFADNCDSQTRLMTRTPDSILEPMNKVQKYLQSFSCSNRKALWHLINYFIQYGGVIITNDTNRRFFFDQGQFERIIEASRKRVVPEMPVDPQERLDYFAPPIDPVDEKVDSPAEEPLTPESIRTMVSEEARESLNGLSHQYPRLTSIIEELGLLAQHSFQGDRKEATSASFALAMILDELLSEIRRQIEDEALETLAGEISTTPTRTHGCDVSIKIKSLQQFIAPLQRRLDGLRRAQTVVEDDRSYIQNEIIDQELKPRLEFSSKEDCQLITAAIERAYEKIEEIDAYIQKLLRLRSPIEDQLKDLLRLQNALKVCQMAPPVEHFEEVSAGTDILSAPPEFDEEELLSWQASEAPILPPEDAEDTNEVPDGTPCSLEDETLIIAAYQIIGTRKSSWKVADALFKLGLLGSDSKRRGNIISTAREISRRDQPPLTFCGRMSKKYALYMQSTAATGDTGAIIPTELHERLRSLCATTKPPKPETEPTPAVSPAVTPAENSAKTSPVDSAPLPVLAKNDTKTRIIRLRNDVTTEVECQRTNELTQLQKQIIAVFCLGGKVRTLFKIASVMRNANCFDPMIDYKNAYKQIFKACLELNKSQTFLRFCGSLGGKVLYGVSPDAEISWLDQVFTPEQQETIRRLFAQK